MLAQNAESAPAMKCDTEGISNNRALVYGWVAAMLVALVLFFTNPYFSILEDETSIITAANAPALSTLEVFASGKRMHEHPPLSDLILHFWLPIAGVNPSLLRIPSIIFYSLALFVWAASARKLAGTTAFYATLVFGVFWPFGFHFGRLAGWYSFSFLLMGLLTLAYLRFLECPSWPRWSLVLCLAFAAVLTNYFSWVFLVFILFDALLALGFRSARRYVAVAVPALVVCYGPLWMGFARELHKASTVHDGHGIVATILNCGFNLYAMFVSESVAPWIWMLSIPAAIAIGITVASTVFLVQGTGRRLYFGFLACFGIMAASGIIGTKRLLFISGWLLIGLGCALANGKHPRWRMLLVSSLIVIVFIGWVGILSRKYYASLHYIEPWETLAQEAAQNIGRGQVVISNSPSFLFYLNTSLYKLGLSNEDRPQWAEGPGVISLLPPNIPESFPSNEIMLVRGVNTSAKQRTAYVEQWMISHCRLESSQRLLHDDGFELKKRYFPADVDEPYRIYVEQFDCRR